MRFSALPSMLVFGACFPGPLPIDEDVTSDDTVIDTESIDADGDASSTATTDVPVDSTSTLDVDSGPELDVTPVCPDDCDDENPCNGIESCVEGACASGTPVTCVQPSNPCRENVCVINTGSCVTQDRLDDTTCDDGALCTGRDACSAGQCVGGGLPDDAEDWSHAETIGFGSRAALTPFEGGYLTSMSFSRDAVLLSTSNGEPLTFDVPEDGGAAYRVMMDGKGLVTSARRIGLVDGGRSTFGTWFADDGSVLMSMPGSVAVSVGDGADTVLVPSEAGTSIASLRIARLAPDGKVAWHRQLVAEGEDGQVEMLAMLPLASNLVVHHASDGSRMLGSNGDADSLYPAGSARRAWVSRLDATGRVLGADQLFELGTSVAFVPVVASSDRVSLWFMLPASGSVTFGSGTNAELREAATPTTYLVRSSALGVPLTVLPISGPLESNDLAAAPDDHVVVTLTTRESQLVIGEDQDAIPFDFELPTIFEKGFVVVSAGSEGVRWARSGEGIIVFSATSVERPDGLVVTAVAARGDLDFDEGTTIVGDDGIVRLYLIAWNADGELAWWREVGSVEYALFAGGLSTNVYPDHVSVAADGHGILVAGQSNGEVTLGHAVPEVHTGDKVFRMLVNSLAGIECAEP